MTPCISFCSLFFKYIQSKWGDPVKRDRTQMAALSTDMGEQFLFVGRAGGEFYLQLANS